MKNIILLNGPAGSGKDTIGKQFIEDWGLGSPEFGKIKIRKFAEPLKRAVSAFFNLTPVEYDFYFETHEGKAYKSERFYNKTPRQWLINFSEQYAKLNGGRDIFGKILAHEIAKDFKHGVSTIIVTDSGFQEEADAIMASFAGDTRVWLGKVKRDGYTFDGDSRGYLNSKMFDYSLDINNNIGLDKTMALIYKEVLKDA